MNIIIICSVFYFFRLGSTCNHVAAILFKVDFAWQRGLTNKSCTSLPCEWAFPKSRKLLENKPVAELDWRKPAFAKGGIQYKRF